jgi:cell wall assembly regulator SMI1
MINERRIQDLLARAPKPSEDVIPRGVTEAECIDFERRTGITLPADMRDWLKLANGPGGLYGIRPDRTYLDIESFLSFFPSWLTRKWIPIAGDGCGNNYVLSTQNEYGVGCPVLYFETGGAADAPLYVVASDIGHFLVFILVLRQRVSTNEEHPCPSCHLPK